jgi:hypothetical protein
MGARKSMGTPAVLANKQGSFAHPAGQEPGGSNSGGSMVAGSAVGGDASRDDGGPADGSSRPDERRSDDPSKLSGLGPQMANLRMENIQRAFKEQGVSQDLAQTLAASWDPKTHKQYDAYWKEWSAFCSAQRCGVFAPSDQQFVEWVNIIAKQFSEETVCKKVFVVSSTIRLVDHTRDLAALPQAKQLMKASAKLVKPKSKKNKSIFDISYCVQFLFESPIEEDSSFLKVTRQVIWLSKVILGWRGADLQGVYIENGLKHSPSGYMIRFWDGKRGKNNWSGWTTVRYLEVRFRSLCLCTAIDELLKRIKGLNVETTGTMVRGPQDTLVMDTPLFLAAPSKKADSIEGLEASTINNKAKELLDSIHDDAEGKESWGTKFSGHDFRHAVASHLRDAGFSLDQIANYMQTSEESLRAFYSVSVVRHWDLPRECMSNISMQEAILLPFIHQHLGTDPECVCAGLIKRQ